MFNINQQTLTDHQRDRGTCVGSRWLRGIFIVDGEQNVEFPKRSRRTVVINESETRPKVSRVDNLGYVLDSEKGDYRTNSKDTRNQRSKVTVWKSRRNEVWDGDRLFREDGCSKGPDVRVWTKWQGPLPFLRLSRRVTITLFSTLRGWGKSVKFLLLSLFILKLTSKPLDSKDSFYKFSCILETEF